jgi:hypothetical protein
MYRYLKHNRFTTFNPFQGTEDPAPPHRIESVDWTEEYKDIFFEEAYSRLTSVSIGLIAQVVESTGIHYDNVKDLSRSDFAGDTLLIRGEKVQLDEGMISMLERQLELIGDNPWLFPSFITDLPFRQYKQAFTQVRRKAGLPSGLTIDGMRLCTSLDLE